MCWVMPPASVLTTDDSRMASSSVVLPWSTWPMIVTTGGRSTRVVGSSSKTTSSSSSSSVCWIVISRLSSVPISSTASSVSETVSVTICLRSIISVMILAGEMPSASARSLTVMPDGTLTGPVGTSGSRFGSDRGAPRSRRWARSEEHTSELQSRRDLVCRLLLEKKKKKIKRYKIKKKKKQAIKYDEHQHTIEIRQAIDIGDVV